MAEATTTLRLGERAPDRLFRLAVPFIIVTLAVGLVLARYHDQSWWPPDDGAYAHVAQRIAAGEVLNRDVQDIHAGYVNFANALALRLFGDSLLSLRYPLVILGLAQAWLLFAMFVGRSPVLAVVAPIASTALAFVQFPNPTAHWYCLFLTIAIIACLGRGRSGSTSRLVAVGMLIGCLFLFRQLTGVLVGIATLAYLLSEAGAERDTDERALASTLLALAAAGLAGYLLAKASPSAMVLIGLAPVAALVALAFTVRVRNRTAARIAAGLVAGATAAALPLVAYHAVNLSLLSWYADVVGAALTLTEMAFFDHMRLHTIALLGLARVFTAETWAHGVNGAYWTVLALLPAALGLRVVRGLLAGEARRPPAPLPFVAMFYAVVSVHYEIWIYLVFSTALTLAGYLWMLDGRRPGAASGSVVALGLAAVGLYFHAGQSLDRRGGFLLGARTEAVACPGLARLDLRISASECARYRHLVALIQRETRPTDAIFAFPTNSEFYYLAGRRNPTRFFNAALGLAVAGEPAATLERLSRDPPALVIHQTDDKYNTPATGPLADMVRARYVLIEVYDRFHIYRLRRPDGG
jgi:hypothetical protein